MTNPLAVCLSMIVAVVMTVQPVLGAAPAGTGDNGVAAAREVIAAQLMELGRPAGDARAAAAALTAEDLLVLVANPAMMQPAGQTMTRSLMLGLILIAVLVIIASSSNGFLSISS